LFESLGARLNEAQSLVDQGETFRIIGDRPSALHAYEQAWDRYSAAVAADVGGRIARERGLMLGTEIYQMHLDRMDAGGMVTTQSRLEEFMAATPPQPEGLLGGVVGDVVGQSVRSLVGQNAVLVPLYRAVASRDAGDEQEASQGFDAALEAARESDPSQRGFLEAVVLGTAHRYQEAAAAYRLHLEGTSGPGGSLMDLMAGLLGGGERAQAEAREQQKNVHEQAAAMFTRLRSYREAMAHFDALRDLGGPEWWRRGSRPWESLSDGAEVLEGLERFDEALQGYERAIEELEARRALLSLDELKTALSGGRGAQYLYFQASRTAMKLAESDAGGADSDDGRRWLAKGFELAERGKARSLVDLMAAGAERAGRGRDRDAIRAWREATTRLAAWRGLLALERTRRDPEGPDPELLSDLTARLEAGEGELVSLRERLAREDPGLHRALNPQADVAPPDDVAGRLPAGTALILYSYLGEDLLAWAISSKGIVAHHRGPLDQRALDRGIRAFHGACERGEPAEALGRPLSDALLVPMEAAIRAHDHLILVPSGAAHSLPFHALPWEGGPLGAHRVVSYLPSAGALRFLPSRGADLGIGRLLAVGNPTGMSIRTVPADEVQTLAPLPAAAAEAAYVATLVPDGRALIGAEATEPAVRSALEGAGVLHFATHAYLSEEMPLLSSVVLANGDALTLLDLMGLRLEAGLVVLSACRTALGETTRGDDVLGLTRGLLAAGARSAVVSLWPVDDVSTGLLMGHFYRRLIAGDGAPAALQAAQAHLRELTAEAMSAERAEMAAALVDAGGDEAAVVAVDSAGSSRDVRRRGGPIGTADYGHPHYWAPFVLVGA
jgi:CHAT domain-containing protein/tetratricopeptide (TPR) repeat protein